MISSVYDYYISTYGNRTLSRHDSHKRSELRDLCNSIAKLNKAAPIYKIDFSPNTQKLAIDIKEAARALTDTLSDFNDIDEGNISIGTIAVCDNPSLMSAKYIGNDSPSDDDQMVFDVQQLAEPQVNTGSYMPIGSRHFFPGTYSFDIEYSGDTYEMQFNVDNDENNGSVQNKIVKIINKAGIGLHAETLKNDFGLQAIRITSEDTGSPKGTPYRFRLMENNDSLLSGAVNVFNLDSVSQYPANAVFDLNGTTSISESNTFMVDGRYEISLNGLSSEYGTATVRPERDGSILMQEFEKLANGYNKLMEISDAEDSFELKRLSRELSTVTKKHRALLENNCFTVNEDNSISVKEDMLQKSATDGSIFTHITNLGRFKTDLREKTGVIEVNPMKYVNKKIVAYKNPYNLIATPYSTSIYTGMMFSRYI